MNARLMDDCDRIIQYFFFENKTVQYKLYKENAWLMAYETPMLLKGTNICGNLVIRSNFIKQTGCIHILVYMYVLNERSWFDLYTSRATIYPACSCTSQLFTI